MNYKKLLLLLLAGALCLSLTACSRGGEPQETPKISLSEMKEDQALEILLADFKEFHPEAYIVSYTVKARIADEDESVKGTLCRTKEAFSFSESIGSSEDKTYYTYKDGVLYSAQNGSKKVKYSCKTAEAEKNLPSYCHFFFNNVDEFESKALLRSEDGGYIVVLSAPKGTFLNLTESVLKAVKEDSSFTPKNPKELFYTLHFSENGLPVGASMGYDLTIDSEGVSVLAKIRIDWTLASENISPDAVSAPEDADSYKQTQPPSDSTEE